MSKFSRSGAIEAGCMLLSAHGGIIEMVRDGEVLAQIAIPPGRVPIVEYMSLLPDGAWYETDDLSVIYPRSLVGAQTFGDVAFETGANPDFQPTTATRMEMQMRVMMTEMAARDQSREARMRHLESIERIPRSPEPEALSERAAAESGPAGGE